MKNFRIKWELKGEMWFSDAWEYLLMTKETEMGQFQNHRKQAAKEKGVEIWLS